MPCLLFPLGTGADPDFFLIEGVPKLSTDRTLASMGTGVSEGMCPLKVRCPISAKKLRGACHLHYPHPICPWCTMHIIRVFEYCCLLSSRILGLGLWKVCMGSVWNEVNPLKNRKYQNWLAWRESVFIAIGVVFTTSFNWLSPVYSLGKWWRHLTMLWYGHEVTGSKQTQ